MSFATVEPEDQAGPVIGAAMVVGAGIAGMQAALDLAEAGIKVYLLDNAPAIGGTMAMLDKTFPTNDCAMCIMSPKLVEVGRHLNIELINCAEIEALSGEPGNFTVSVKQRPRYVDVEKCTGCGDCAAVCPIDLPDEFNGGLSSRKAIYKPYPQAIPNAYAIEKRGMAPCRDACPIHQRVQGYLALIAEGRYADAYHTILEDNPFPSICGRVCNHRCEQSCNRSQIDAPVNVMALKRFVADWAWENPELTQPKSIPNHHGRLDGRRVAVVGAGPAGLTCARDLVRQGSKVTVFEAHSVAGGMMRLGVPVHRLPAEIVQREVDAILAEGIELLLNHRVEDVESLLDQYEAVFVAIGAHAAVKLPIPGNDLPQVLLATDFLRQVNQSQAVNPSSIDIQNTQAVIRGKRVLVLGGGNVAIDAAMTARRLGASWVGMTCLESRQQMPAHEWELREAEEEEIEVFPSRTFTEIINARGQVAGVRTEQVDFRGFIEGSPDFDVIPGSEEILLADVVIFAIGQRPASDCLKQVTKLRGGRIVADPATLATDVPGVFAGGDAVTGGGAIVDAIAAGHLAAQSIQAFLLEQEVDFSPSQSYSAEVARLTPQEARLHITMHEGTSAARREVPMRNPAERRLDFNEISRAFTEQQARAEAVRCLRCGICSECNQCTQACKAGAIFHQDHERQVDIQVGAVILTMGLESMPGDVRPEYGFGRYPNVVTSLQFERMLSASGPFSGVVQRPSDGRHPRKIAWIQCVGSRETGCTEEAGAYRSTGADNKDITPSSYCSSVCCMYATKEAMIAKEHDPQIEPAIFYIDVRSFGKGFDTYVERAQDEQGIRYIRCMVSSVKEVPGTRNLRLSYVTWEGVDGKKPRPHEEEFDLVVLSVGLRPGQAAMQTARRLGIDLNAAGFAKVSRHAPAQTSLPGVFVAGSFAEPKDIPESVIEASCAAAQVSALLGRARGTLTRQPVYPVERDTRDEVVRVGVFVCHCGINIGAVVDTPAVVEEALRLPGVVYAEHNLYTCSQDTQERIRQRIEENRLNRVVVASCTPRTHEPLFQDTLRQAGLNPYLFEMANIREQDSWVHRSSPQDATSKAKQLVAMAVSKARKLHEITRNTFEIDHHALVIGGGLAGMTAALSIAQQGFEVYLVERETSLGGNLRHIHTSSSPGENPQELLRTMIRSVNSNPSIEVITAGEVIAVQGYAGQFRSTIRTKTGITREVQHGVIVLATGGREIQPVEYLYGRHISIMTQRQLEEHLNQPEFAATLASSTIAMIQCAGSRDQAHSYCSRICCTQALKNSLVIKRRAPQSRVYIIFRDLRSYGFREQLYQEARRRGVIFLEYEEANKPKVTPGENGKINIEVAVQPEHETLTIPTDWLVLSAGVEPEPGNPALAHLLKVPLNADGFFLEAHVKLRPVDFAAEGIFLAGLAHSPRSIEETIAQSQAAAIRAAALLVKPRLEATPIVASVNSRLCAACGACVEVCPYGARVLEPGMTHAEVIEVLCQGCGACAAVCPNKATQQKGFRLEQVLGMLEAAVS